MQFKSAIVFFLSVASVSLASVPAKRSVSTVLADVSTISSKVSTLDSLINAYPATGGTLAGALAIHNAAASTTTGLIPALATGTSDVTSTGPVGDADGATILSAVQAFEPTILDALTGIVAKKPSFVALPLGGVPALILQDLTNLKAGTAAFSNALIANAPASTTASATTLRDTILAAFDTAIAAYS
ncbi:hydrophobic surface binding protein [Pholiota conissans]|uniref:Hydrophobic surface binding protein n=1 Tax=Pholiota conissans TaxID=109636 RepID=A0A9P6CYV5_9AGAR|nr:hydrophobic surface binding protein [Pholiota conissans]